MPHTSYKLPRITASEVAARHLAQSTVSNLRIQRFYVRRNVQVQNKTVLQRQSKTINSSVSLLLLLPDVTSAPTLTVFRNCLKTHLFSRSFPS